MTTVERSKHGIEQEKSNAAHHHVNVLGPVVTKGNDGTVITEGNRRGHGVLVVNQFD